ncbi:MAG: hypothetical protein HQK96_10775 [Nitrospirae bacterium]|nr:hypothetical protein [Nitrospirota bacterium]
MEKNKKFKLPVGALKSEKQKKSKRDISQEPEMASLKETFREMSEGERERTIGYLKDQGIDNIPPTP